MCPLAIPHALFVTFASVLQFVACSRVRTDCRGGVSVKGLVTSTLVGEGEGRLVAHIISSDEGVADFVQRLVRPHGVVAIPVPPVLKRQLPSCIGAWHLCLDLEREGTQKGRIVWALLAVAERLVPLVEVLPGGPRSPCGSFVVCLCAQLPYLCLQSARGRYGAATRGCRSTVRAHLVAMRLV